MTIDLVSTLSRAAGRAEPLPLDDADARASSTTRCGPNRDASGVRPFKAVAVTALASVATVWPVRPHAGEQRAELTLPTGDHLARAAGARFEVEAVEPAHAGSACTVASMFDVAHVVAGQRFGGRDHPSPPRRRTVVRRGRRRRIARPRVRRHRRGRASGLHALARRRCGVGQHALADDRDRIRAVTALAPASRTHSTRVIAAAPIAPVIAKPWSPKSNAAPAHPAAPTMRSNLA